MIAVLLLAQTDSTGRKISWIVFGLVAVAAGLALLTAWYWRSTDPARRLESAKGGGGPRRRRDVDPEPEPVRPEPSTGQVPPVNPKSTVTAPEVPADQTRVLDRSEILEPKVSSTPSVIDLRIQTPDPVEPPRPEERKIKTVTDETAIDLTHLEAEAKSERIGDATGAHDQGLDFDDWLALAEDDK